MAWSAFAPPGSARRTTATHPGHVGLDDALLFPRHPDAVLHGFPYPAPAGVAGGASNNTARAMKDDRRWGQESSNDSEGPSSWDLHSRLHSSALDAANSIYSHGPSSNCLAAAAHQLGRPAAGTTTAYYYHSPTSSPSPPHSSSCSSTSSGGSGAASSMGDRDPRIIALANAAAFVAGCPPAPPHAGPGSGPPTASIGSHPAGLSTMGPGPSSSGPMGGLGGSGGLGMTSVPGCQIDLLYAAATAAHESGGAGLGPPSGGSTPASTGSSSGSSTGMAPVHGGPLPTSGSSAMAAMAAMYASPSQLMALAQQYPHHQQQQQQQHQQQQQQQQQQYAQSMAAYGYHMQHPGHVGMMQRQLHGMPSGGAFGLPPMRPTPIPQHIMAPPPPPPPSGPVGPSYFGNPPSDLKVSLAGLGPSQTRVMLPDAAALSPSLRDSFNSSAAHNALVAVAAAAAALADSPTSSVSSSIAKITMPPAASSIVAGGGPHAFGAAAGSAHDGISAAPAPMSSTGTASGTSTDDGSTPNGPFTIRIIIYNPNVRGPEGGWMCEACGREFQRRPDLVPHIRTHTGEKPFLCSHPGCFKDFAHSSNLRAHERAHRGEKPYMCDEPGCGLAFAHSNSLRDHKLSHTGDRPYVCSYEGCGASFAAVANLGRHHKLHKKYGGVLRQPKKRRRRSSDADDESV